MTSIPNISPNIQAALSRDTSLKSITVADPFANLVNDLLAQNSPSAQPGENAIQAQERIADFQRKLALLSGIAQQAQEALSGQKPIPGGFTTPEEQEYYFAESQLRQVGLPGAVLDVV